MKKIKIIHVITDKNIAGAGRWLLGYLKYYDKEKFDVKVIVPSDSSLNEPLKKLNADIIYIEDMAEESFSKKDIKKFKYIFKQYKPDIVHTHASLSARIGAKLSGIRCIINTKHCLENITTNPIKRMLKRTINKVFSNKIVAVSNAVKDSMTQSGIDEKQIVTIYNGIEINKCLTYDEKQKIRESLGIEPDKKIIGIAARLEIVKNIETFLEMAKKILDKRKNYIFIIAGTGSQADYLKEFSKKLGICDNVLFMGFVDDIERLMNIFDINTITSINEALCLSILEGMSMGIPAVGTDSGGVREAVLDNINGRLVSCKDSTKMAEDVIEIVENQELYKLYSTNAINHVKDKFLVQNVIKELENLYINSVGEK